MSVITKGEKTRTQVIKEARKLIVANGFKNTSINEIIAATGVKKGSLYFHFANKDELGLAILLDAKEEFFNFLSDSLCGKTPYEKIDHFMLALLEQQKNTNFVGGCLFANTALEMSDSNERFAEIIMAVFSEWIEIFTDLLREAAENKQISSKIAPELLAKTVVAALEGGIMLSRVSKNISDLMDCIKVVRTIIKN